jgi:hypothetical protein
VEVETHPVNADEYRFLTGGEILRRTRHLRIARGFTNPAEARAAISAEDRRGSGN